MVTSPLDCQATVMSLLHGIDLAIYVCDMLQDSLYLL